MLFYLCQTISLSADLTGRATRVYHYLSKMQNHKTAACWPKKETIAADLSISQSTVSRALKELKEKELIKVTVRKDMTRPQGKRQISNLYRLTSHQLSQSERLQPNSQKTLMRSSRAAFSLSGTELKVYTYLCKRANKSNVCFPSYKTIAAELNICRLTAIRAVTALVKYHMIHKKVRPHAAYRGGKATGCNVYTILVALPSCAKKIKRKLTSSLRHLFHKLKQGKKKNRQYQTSDSSKTIYSFIIHHKSKKARLFFFLFQTLRR